VLGGVVVKVSKRVETIVKLLEVVKGCGSSCYLFLSSAGGSETVKL
jgi:hypothetical protein